MSISGKLKISRIFKNQFCGSWNTSWCQKSRIRVKNQINDDWYYESLVELGVASRRDDSPTRNC